MRRMLSSLAILALLAGGCSKDQPVAAPSESATPVVVTEAPTTEPPPPPIAALTGIELPEALERPIVAVKIDNAAAALPPEGLDAADIVIEEEVEGGLTRFLVLFHSDDPEEVGPVRSGREADADLLPAFSPVLGFSGADNSVKKLLSAADVSFFEEGEADGAFYRVPDRIAPHNLFAHTEQLFAAGDELPVPDKPVFAFDEQVPDGGRQTGSADLVFSSYASATWTWQDDKSNWAREQNGSAHVTAEGRQITADNVVVMRVETSVGNRTDSAGNPTVALDVIGKGKATVLRDGQAFTARWRKDSPEDQIEWLTNDGRPLALRPGQTWIEILAIDETLELHRKTSDVEE